MNDKASYISFAINKLNGDLNISSSPHPGKIQKFAFCALRSLQRFLALLLFFLLPLLWLQCAAPIRPSASSTKKNIDRLRPDNRILQAEDFYREGEQRWALYAWNQTRLEDLTSDEGRESYRLLKNQLFRQALEAVYLKLENIQVSAMYLDFDDLWLGTWNGGIYRLSLSSGEAFTLVEDQPSLVPRVVYRIRKSSTAFWFATHQGVRFYNYRTGENGWLQIPSVRGAVNDFLENSEGLFIASLQNGTWHRLLSGDLSRLGGAQDPLVLSLEWEPQLGLILGTAKQGAFLWQNGKREALQNFEPAFQALKHINHIVSDGSSLWFASAGEGLFRWNFADRRPPYQILQAPGQNLLRSNRISALLHSGDWIFIGDERGGLAGYHLGDQKWYIWDSGRNLEFSSISALAYRDGELFYSTLTGGIYQIHWLRYLFALREKN